MAGTVIGVTGNMAAGKSEVARQLREKGCALVDADKVAHEVYAENSALVSHLVNAFGRSILDERGRLLRESLGRIVFSDPEALERLNGIVHPVLKIEIRQRIRQAQRVMRRVVLDAALIVEFGVHKELDFLILVTAAEPIRLERLMARSRMSSDEALSRIRAQADDLHKRELADWVIENNGSAEELRRQVDAAWEKVMGLEEQS